MRTQNRRIGIDTGVPTVNLTIRVPIALWRVIDKKARRTNSTKAYLIQKALEEKFGIKEGETHDGQ